MSADGQRTKCHSNIAENYNRLSRLHERYRQTDRRQTDTAYSEREHEFTFTKNPQKWQKQRNAVVPKCFLTPFSR